MNSSIILASFIKFWKEKKRRSLNSTCLNEFNSIYFRTLSLTWTWAEILIQYILSFDKRVKIRFNSFKAIPGTLRLINLDVHTILMLNVCYQIKCACGLKLWTLYIPACSNRVRRKEKGRSPYVYPRLYSRQTEIQRGEEWLLLYLGDFFMTFIRGSIYLYSFSLFVSDPSFSLFAYSNVIFHLNKQESPPFFQFTPLMLLQPAVTFTFLCILLYNRSIWMWWGKS